MMIRSGLEQPARRSADMVTDRQSLIDRRRSMDNDPRLSRGANECKHEFATPSQTLKRRNTRRWPQRGDTILYLKISNQSAPAAVVAVNDAVVRSVVAVFR